MKDLKQIQEFFSKPLEENIVVRMYNTTDKTADLYKEDNPGLEFYLTGEEGQDYVRKYKNHISFPFSSHMNDGTPIPNYEENKEKLAAYLKQKGIPFKTTSAKPYRGVSRTTGEDFMYTTDTFKVPLSHVDIKDISLKEGKQLDQVDFAKVVKAVEQTGHPVTVLLVPKFNEIEVITGMNAPDDMLRDLSNAVDSLGYGRNDIFIAGDSSNLSRREYSDIRRVNGGAKDYFEESVNEGPDSYARVSKPRFVKDKNNSNFLNVYLDYDIGPGGATVALGKETMTGQIRRLSSAKARKVAHDIALDLEANFNLEDIEVTDLKNGKVRIFAVSDDFIDMDPNMLSGIKESIVTEARAPKTKEASKSALEKVRDMIKEMIKEGDMSLDDQAKAYYLAKVKRGEIDTLPPNPKAAFLAQMMKDQMDHDKETLRRERGLEEKAAYIAETIKLGMMVNEDLCEKGKRYIKARQAAGEKSSAYLSGRAVRVCKGQIEWPKKGKKKK